MNQNAEEIPEGTLRELIIDLPPGMIGNPFAVPSCTGADFEGVVPLCPGNTQVGIARIRDSRISRHRGHPHLQPDPADGGTGEHRLQHRQLQRLQRSIAAQQRLRGEDLQHHDSDQQGNAVGGSGDLGDAGGEKPRRRPNLH